LLAATLTPQPYPHAVFELGYFKRNPRPFFMLAKELFPGNYLPTPTHYFMRLLHDKGLLMRCFTQVLDRPAARVAQNCLAFSRLSAGAAS
jgi:NAD-dependent SIR2 family protein deacetylase